MVLIHPLSRLAKVGAVREPPLHALHILCGALVSDVTSCLVSFYFCYPDGILSNWLAKINFGRESAEGD